MPIRFRCVYCNQLLGISRRKAGTIVRCTTCEGQLIVPEPSDPATEAARDEGPVGEPALKAAAKPEGSSGESPGGVFAASEFDEFLQPLHGGAAGGPAVASPPAPSPAKRSAAVPVVAPEADVAVTLSRRGLTIAAVVAVLAVGLSFAAGLWLGLALR
jgi:hypothetical protein